MIAAPPINVWYVAVSYRMMWWLVARCSGALTVLLCRDRASRGESMSLSCQRNAEESERGLKSQPVGLPASQDSLAGREALTAKAHAQLLVKKQTQAISLLALAGTLIW